MAILFKTYNGRNQLHVYGENWTIDTSADLKKVLALFDQKNALKATIVHNDKNINLNLNDMIIECKGMTDLKNKFGVLAEFKVKHQIIQKK